MFINMHNSRIQSEKEFTHTPKFVKRGWFSFFKNQRTIESKENSGCKTLVGGFTLIEVMISIGLFTVVMIVGITAILGVNNTYRKSRTMRSAIDNLSFIMEDMGRNIRLGYLYKCVQNDQIPSTEVEEPEDGVDCPGIAFEPFWDPVSGETALDQDQVVYFISEDSEGFGSIYKSMDGGANYAPMNSLDVNIDLARSGFTIFGTSDTDDEQPAVLITLAGVASSGAKTTDFHLQTTVSQRLFDAPVSGTGGTGTGGVITIPGGPGDPGGGI